MKKLLFLLSMVFVFIASATTTLKTETVIYYDQVGIILTADAVSQEVLIPPLHQSLAINNEIYINKLFTVPFEFDNPYGLTDDIQILNLDRGLEFAKKGIGLTAIDLFTPTYQRKYNKTGIGLITNVTDNYNVAINKEYRKPIGLVTNKFFVGNSLMS